MASSFFRSQALIALSIALTRLSSAQQSEVVEAWVAVYSGSGSLVDQASDLVLDRAGNVYVAGCGVCIGTGSDYVTIKYSPEGTQQWVATFNGPENLDDFAGAIALDMGGNVFVTGSSDVDNSYGQSDSISDYATVCYDPNGIQLWVAPYDGPGGRRDRAYSIAVDEAGKAYVAGRSTGIYATPDCATVMYDADGQQQWAARFEGPGGGCAIAVDDAGNVYVTGDGSAGETGYDYTTIKYNPDGIEEWSTRLDGPGHSSDFAYDLALDGFGNVYVTGYVAMRNGDKDYGTVKYDSSGAVQWVAYYNGPGSAYDQAGTIEVDEAGSVYVTGFSTNSAGDWDYATVKYDSSGVEQWVSRYDGLGHGMDWAYDLAVDERGSVYVTGSSEGIDTSSDIVTIKYDSTGVEQWLIRYDGEGNGTDQARAIALDGVGGVVVTGSSCRSGTGEDIVTIKYEQINCVEEDQESSLSEP